MNQEDYQKALKELKKANLGKAATSLPPPAPVSTARPGDVLFVYSGGKEAACSCIAQRLIFDGLRGPWYSHVAVGLSDEFVIEAYTEPEENETTWSGVSLKGGVRLRLLPDIVFPAKTKFSVLRNTSLESLDSWFAATAPHIRRLIGVGYSTKPLVALAKQTNTLISKVIPVKTFDWYAAPDRLSEYLRRHPQLQRDLAEIRSVPAVQFVMQNYFCSQLAGMLLWQGGLLSQDPGVITPCGLYDKLIQSGWSDVTKSHYGDDAKTRWEMTKKLTWQLQYKSAVASDDYLRMEEFKSAMLNGGSKAVEEFLTRYDASIQKADEMVKTF